ncbi:MAG: thioredoxin-dependent thiol peroxidase [Verrucomicrobiota bacterium]
MATKRPEVGDEAPGFAALAVGGEYGEGTEVSLGDFSGRDVVLYFYPKDDTPGCTTQACGIRDAWGELSKRAVVFGVSVDGVKKHEKFIDKYELPFPLISDEEREVVEAYGVWVEKQLYGKKYMGTERTTFVIGSDGVIRAVFPKVKPAEHVEKVLEVLS